MGILAPKSAASVIAVYGALKARACYVPIDQKAPAERISYVVKDSGIAVVVADDNQTAQFTELAGRVSGIHGLTVANPQ